MKRVLEVHGTPDSHWVGDGFPVRSLLSYNEFGEIISPFLLLDFAGPAKFAPAAKPRGVGPHPHRGFETVTIVYEGEVAHRDSTGNGGVIGPGDVQWMTAAGGILHDEFHSPDFTRAGGSLRMIQLWVNLPAKHKLGAPGYQAILDKHIPSVALPDGAGRIRVIAGDYDGNAGPARSFTPIELWDLRVTKGKTASLDLPEGHTAMLVPLSGAITVNGAETAREAEMVLLDRQGKAVSIAAGTDATVLVLGGEPIAEPVVGYGPFVMNTEAEIERAIADFQQGRFGRMPPH